MKPVDQIEFRKTLGDCFRACAASILEFPINEMPNFWEQTQDAHVFWQKVNEWLAKNHKIKAITTAVQGGHEYLIEDVLCVAIGNTERGSEEHCVVWLNGTVHDPHPSRCGLYEAPICFTLFVPLDPLQKVSA